MDEPSIYPWEVLEEVLRDLGVPRPGIVARQLLDGLVDRGWEVRKDERS
jgi:hypothetical protein